MVVLVIGKVAGRIAQSGRKVFRNRLLITNAMFSTMMGAIGDLVQQRYDMLTNAKNDGHWKPIRTSHMAAAGLTTGVLSHSWYMYAERIFPGRRFIAIVKKVLCDQIVFSPVCISLYFATVAILEGSMQTLKEEIQEKGSKIYIAEWIVWPPVQFFNFYVLPMKYRVIFDNLVSFGFDIYSPYIKYKCKPKPHDENKASIL